MKEKLGMNVPLKLSEWQLIRNEKWLFALITWLPPLLFILIYLIFYRGIPQECAIGVVDLDHSRISRMITRYYDASPMLNVVESYDSQVAGTQALRGGEIYGLVIIGADTEKEIYRGTSPDIDVFYNSQYLLIGKIVKSAIAEAHGNIAARIDIVKNLMTGGTPFSEAYAQAIPISTQVTPLYNISKNYAQFLVSAIIPAIWQILIVVATVYSLTCELRNSRYGSITSWLQQKPFATLFRKSIPYTIIFWIHGLLFLVGLFVLSGWPMHGSLLIVACTQLLTVCACQATGMLIFLIIKDPTRSLSMAAAYTAPGLAFMGVTFPTSDMLLPAQIWQKLLPASHYIAIQISQMNYGATLLQSGRSFLHLLLFAIPAVLCALLAHRYSQTYTKRST